MRNISTLFYLVDDMNLPLDTMLNPIENDPLKDEFFCMFLNLLEVDPGIDKVAQIMDRIKKIG